jgi:hypothetical protein
LMLLFLTDFSSRTITLLPRCIESGRGSWYNSPATFCVVCQEAKAISKAYALPTEVDKNMQTQRWIHLPPQGARKIHKVADGAGFYARGGHSSGCCVGGSAGNSSPNNNRNKTICHKIWPFTNHLDCKLVVRSVGSADLIKLLNFLPTRAQSAANNRAGACVCLLVRMTSAESIK